MRGPPRNVVDGQLTTLCPTATGQRLEGKLKGCLGNGLSNQNAARDLRPCGDVLRSKDHLEQNSEQLKVVHLSLRSC